MSSRVSKYFQRKKKAKSPTASPKVDKTQVSRPANVDLQSRASAEPSASGQVSWASCELLHGHAYGCQGMPLMVLVFGLHSALHATLNIWSRIAVARSFNTATLPGQVTRLHSVSLAHAIECLRMPHTHTQRVQTLYSGSSIRSMLNMWAYMWRCIHSRSVGASCVYPHVSSAWCT